MITLNLIRLLLPLFPAILHYSFGRKKLPLCQTQNRRHKLKVNRNED